MSSPCPLRLLPAIAAVLLVLSACASSHVITGTPRPPIHPSEVRIYHGPPPGRFEEIALLQVSSGAFTYGSQNKTDAVMANLRREAAALGANGVLLQGTATGHGGSGVNVGAGGGRVSGSGSSFSSVGVGVNISPQRKHATGIAIHVEDPPPLDAPDPQP